MGCTGAPIIEVLRDAGPLDGFCLTSAACPECVKSHGTEPQARIASCALRRPTLLRFINPNASANELKTTLMSHSIIHGDAYFAYFNKIWGIP
jgi:hypothetical protein